MKEHKFLPIRQNKSHVIYNSTVDYHLKRSVILIVLMFYLLPMGAKKGIKFHCVFTPSFTYLVLYCPHPNNFFFSIAKTFSYGWSIIQFATEEIGSILLIKICLTESEAICLQSPLWSWLSWDVTFSKLSNFWTTFFITSVPINFAYLLLVTYTFTCRY